jgi:homoserine kinase
MKASFEARGVACRSWTLDVDLNGAQVEPPGEVPIPKPEPVL